MSNCRYIKQNHNYTPNDYNVEFDYTEIPSNITWNGATDIETTLNHQTPITKQIHLTMNTTDQSTTNGLRLNTTTIFEEIR